MLPVPLPLSVRTTPCGHPLDEARAGVGVPNTVTVAETKSPASIVRLWGRQVGAALEPITRTRVHFWSRPVEKFLAEHVSVNCPLLWESPVKVPVNPPGFFGPVVRDGTSD
jgi:hypothetical protein